MTRTDLLAPVTVARAQVTPSPRRTLKKPRWGTHIFLIILAVMWMIPLAWTVFLSLRPEADVNRYGAFSLGGAFNFDNYVNAWTEGEYAAHLMSSAIITIPAVLVTLLFSSAAAFAFSRFSWRFNIGLLIVFTAGNLLPAQVVAAPVFLLFKSIQLPYSVSDSGSLLNTFTAVIIAEAAFQIGFTTFVLANYMRALPHELKEAALIDGAGVWRQYWSITLPLSRPALAAMATLLSIWVYNGFFWPLLLIQSPDRLPVTTSVNSLFGQFSFDIHLVAAGAIITVVPALIVYLLLQRQFLAGLTLGSTKG